MAAPDVIRMLGAAGVSTILGMIAVGAQGLHTQPPHLAPSHPAPEVTFTKHIAPILQRSCENCHRPDGVAPMSLRTYDEARPWARAIKQRTGLGPRAGVMPPWYGREEHRHPGVQERSVAQ